MLWGLKTATLAAILVGASSSPAAAKLAGGCGGPADSALNQYCETLPTAKGPQPPVLGRAGRPRPPALASALPPRVARAIANGQSRAAQAEVTAAQARVTAAQAQALRARAKLAAADLRRPDTAPLRVNRSSTSGLPLWLILLLAALALGLITAAVVRSRRGPPPVSGEGAT